MAERTQSPHHTLTFSFPELSEGHGSISLPPHYLFSLSLSSISHLASLSLPRQTNKSVSVSISLTVSVSLYLSLPLCPPLCLSLCVCVSISQQQLILNVSANCWAWGLPIDSLPAPSGTCCTPWVVLYWNLLSFCNPFCLLCSQLPPSSLGFWNLLRTAASVGSLGPQTTNCCGPQKVRGGKLPWWMLPWALIGFEPHSQGT